MIQSASGCVRKPYESRFRPAQLSRPLAYTAFADERAGETVTARLKSPLR
jgi:hypothetical protein